MASLADEKYISFTTYKKDGSARSTATWVVGLDGGKVGFWTSSGSWKAKRLANNPKVVVQASDSRGRAKQGSTPINGTAVLVTGAEFAPIVAAVKAKYGFQTKVTKLLFKLGHLFKKGAGAYGDTGVVVTLDS